LRLPLALLVLVICQAAFGAWTVTLKLWPQIVTTHLLGGFATLSLLWLLALRMGVGDDWRVPRRLLPHGLLALVLVVMQIALGGWVSSNYAALACHDFPTCHGDWWPAMDLRAGFDFAQTIGPNYLGGELESDARVAIHYSHRIGALAVLLMVGALIWRMLRAGAALGRPPRRGARRADHARHPERSAGAAARYRDAAQHRGGGVVADSRCSKLSRLSSWTDLMSDATVALAGWRDYLELTKPRVVLLMLLCAMVGMFLAVPGMVPIDILVFGLVGIALVAGSAAVVNHIADAEIDARMARTQARPVATGRIGFRQGLAFSGLLGISGMLILYFLVNPLTAWLNLASWVGYGLVYTLFLKRATPQNIVIGGLFGAAPPLFGWAAVSNSVEPGALLLVLIIFAWTPPHFWALALDRKEEYASVDVPMLPVTHGEAYTRLHIFFYTLDPARRQPAAIRDWYERVDLPRRRSRARWRLHLLGHRVAA
jgi:heme o synthase